MAKAHQLRARRWHIVNWNFSFWPKRFTMSISATRPVKWRRIDVIPGWGSFKTKKESFVCFGFVQVMSRENRTCTITTHGETVELDTLASSHQRYRVPVAPDSFNLDEEQDA